MKLLFSIATIFMFLGFTVGSYGDNHSIQAFVYVSSTQTEPLAVGEQMHLNIQILGGKSVSGYELTVGFDPTALRYIESGNADYLPAGAFVVPPITSDSSVYIATTSPPGPAFTSEGTLATLTFEVIAAKGSTIKLMDVILSDSAGMPLPVTSENGRIVATELPENWDVNEDRKVNILDLTLVASNLNADVPANPRADVNKDGKVNILDLVLVAQNLDAAGGDKNKPEVKVNLVEFNLAESYAAEFVRFVSAHPPSGSTIAPDIIITLTFNNEPSRLIVRDTPVDLTDDGYFGTSVLQPGTGKRPPIVFGRGKVRKIAGDFTPGPLTLTITWTDGIHMLNYTVSPPDTDPPTVTGGTVKDGDEDVDPAVINTEGKIEIAFSEEVTGHIALQTEGGDDIGWLGKVEGNKGVLELAKGKEISNGATYVIICLVTDAAGNRAEIRTVFVTKRDNNERGDLVEEEPIVQTSKVSFKDDIQPILADRCAIPGCHSASSAAGLNLSQYNTFKKGGDGGAAFRSGNGKGSLVVRRIDGGGMPPIPPPLNEEQIQLFIDWINQGAKDN